MKNIILILTLILSSSCFQRSNLLEPAKLPGRYVKSALVSTPSPAYRVRTEGKDLVSIESIDHTPPTFLQSKVIVDPGIHSFQIKMEFWESSARVKDESLITKVDSDIIFQTEANKEYLINAIRNTNGIWLWAEDIDTREVVGGTRP